MITISAFPIALFLLVYWIMNRKPKNYYPNYGYMTIPEYRCKHCRKKSKINYEYCPRCEKNDEGLSPRDVAMIKVMAVQHKQGIDQAEILRQQKEILKTQELQQEQINHIWEKTDRFDSFITALRRKFRF